MHLPGPEQKKSRERILNRAEKEGREDDKNPDVINKRFDEYENKTKPLLDKYRKSRKLIKINASPGSEEVYKQVIDKIGIKPTSLEKEKS